MFGRGHNDTQLWRQVLQTLTPQIDYHHRLDTLLKMVGNLLELPACYLYLLDSEKTAFHLERSWLATTPQEKEPTSNLYGPDETGHGAADMMFPPPLNIPLTDDSQGEQFVPTPAGNLYSIPLHMGTKANNDTNDLIGLLQVGPLSGNRLPRQTQQAIDTIHFPLSLAVQQAYQEETLQQQLSAATTRSEVGQRLRGSALEVDRFVKLLLNLALTATQTEAGFVAIVETGTQQLTIRAYQNIPPTFLERVDLSPESGLFDWSLAGMGGALLVRDFEFVEEIGLRSILAVPLLEGEEPLGVFALVNFKRAETFTEHNLTLLETFVEQIKLVVHNGRLFHSFTAQYLETVKGLARSLDVRRPYTQNHHQQVAQVGLTIAQAMGLDDEQIDVIHTAGLIHDVGMAGIVEVADGFQADLEHPTIGASMIENLPVPPTIAKAIATHHEWFDGWGFPQGLKGEDIPLEGRILALAEFIIEMTTPHPIREPWSLEKLLDELQQRRGNQFDPHAIDTAIMLIQNSKLQLPDISLA